MSETPATTTASNATSPGSYPVGRPRGVCSVTGQKIEPHTPYVAALREAESGLERVDYTEAAFEALPAEQQAAHLAHWHTTMPEPDPKKRKLLVDDEVLMELFRRLEGAETQEKLAFRVMLGLMLMRKKKLNFEGEDTDEDGREVWIMRPRKSEQTYPMVDPKLAEDQLESVGEQVKQVLADGVDEEELAA